MNNQTIQELNNRNLDSCLISIVVIPSKIFCKEGDDLVNEKTIYLFFGCNINGKRKFLSAALSDNFPKTSDWYNFLLSLKNRGINSLFFAVIPNNDYLSKALKLSFKEINVFISCYDTISKLSKYYTDSYSRAISFKIKSIFLAHDLTEFNLCFNNFKDEFLNITFISDLLQDDFKRAKSYFSFDFQTRKFVFAFYFYRDTSKRANALSHSKPFFSSIDDFVSLLIPDIQRIESGMFCPKSELNFIINKLYESHSDLLKIYL